MATLGPLAPTSDGTISTAIDNETNRTTPYYTHIDEDPASPGSDAVTNDQSETDGEYFVGFTSTAADFGSMDQSLKIQHSVQAFDDGSSNDALDCYASVVASDESTAYTDEVIIGDELDITKATTESTWVVNATGLAASKADWDAAFVKLRWDYQKTGAGDNNQLFVYAFELNGTYTLFGTVDQANFRIRAAGDGPGINVDSGWEAALNINATMDVESQFGIRFEAEEEGVGGKTLECKAQYNWSGDAGWNDLTAPGYPTPTGNVAVVAFANSNQWADGAATTNILSGSAGAFVAGSGEESNNSATVVLTSTDHTEFEIQVMIRKVFAGAGGFTTDGQTVQFRLVESDGTVFNTYTQTPTITINHPVGLIGGVFGETTGLTGPIADSNGNIYVIPEHAQLNAPIFLCVLKSTDGGDSWVPQDDSDWTSSGEGEAIDTHFVQADDTIYMGWQASTDVQYREFLVSTEATNPDTYVAAEVDAANPASVADQAAAIVRRSDNTTVLFYAAVDTDGKLYYRIRTSGGSWGGELTMEGEASIDWTGVQIVIGASDLIHIIYSNKSNTGEIYYRNLNSSNTLSGRTSVLTGTDTDPHHSPVLKPVYWDDGGTEKIMLAYYKPSDGKLYTRVVTSGSVGAEFAAAATDNTVASDIATSGQPTAKLAIDGTTAYIIYANAADQDIYYTSSDNGAAWNTDTELEDEVTCDLISANIFTHSAGNGSAKVLGYMYADNRFGAGNTGDVVYNELELGTLNLKSIAGALTFIGTVATVRLFFEAVAGALTFAGAVLAKPLKALAGAVTFTGTVARKMFESLAGALTFSGALAATKKVFQAVAGALTFTGTLAGKPLKALAGAVSFTGTLTGKALKALAGALTFTGTLKGKTLKVVAGAVTFTGTLTNKALKALAGAVTFTGTLTNKALKALAGAVTFVGGLATLYLPDSGDEFFQAVAGALTFTGAVVKKTSHSMAGTLTMSGSPAKKIKRALAGALTFVGELATIGITLFQALTLRKRTIALTLPERDIVYTLSPRVVDFTLPS